MHYFLIGLPGSGKSTLGKQLASKLSLPFLDTDKLIEKKENCTIEQLFASKGESYFRAQEHEVLKSMATEHPSVISLGGGTPCFFNNMDLILEMGQSIFLDVSPEALCGRLMGDSGSVRPMIKGKKEEEVLSFLIQKRTERLPFYQNASIVLKNDFIQLSDILKALNR